jgi:hypothetical protein
MKSFRRFFGVVTLLLTATGTNVLAAGTTVEKTPVPIGPKPNFSSMQFLVGSWNCTELSSRRPGPFTTTQVYAMDPTGYWIVRNDTIHKASWIPREFHSQTKYTYDDAAKLWVRITTGDQGTYQVATAPMPVGGKKTYTYVIQSKSPDIASYAPEVYVQESDTKKTMTTSFTETGGRVVTVKETCLKS